MAGGTWQTQNKVLPGVYINFQTNQSARLTVGERGTVAICEPMSWGPVGQIMTIEAGADTMPFCGYSLTEPGARFLNEIFKGTNRTDPPKQVLLYRPSASASAQAQGTLGSLTAQAIYPGARGNDITIVITALTEPEDSFQVDTLVSGNVVDSQVGAQVADLVDNAWVEFSGSGALVANSGQALSGGADGTVQAAAYSTFLTALEPYKFDVLIYDGTDTTVMSAYQSFVERMMNDNGQWCQMVAAGMTTPNSFNVINNVGGVVLNDGTTLTPQQTCWWLGGAEAGASYNESLTYAQYPGAVDVNPRFTNSQQAENVSGGEVSYMAEDGMVRMVQDINSLVTFTPEVGSVFHKNRVIRLCSTIANDLYQQFSENYIGVINNNDEGRNMFKAAIISYLLTLQGEQAIQNFEAEDITVEQGEEIDSVVVTLSLQVVDSVEKIYMTVTIS